MSLPFRNAPFFSRLVVTVPPGRRRRSLPAGLDLDLGRPGRALSGGGVVTAVGDGRMAVTCRVAAGGDLDPRQAPGSCDSKRKGRDPSRRAPSGTSQTEVDLGRATSLRNPVARLLLPKWSRRANGFVFFGPRRRLRLLYGNHVVNLIFRTTVGLAAVRLGSLLGSPP